MGGRNRIPLQPTAFNGDDIDKHNNQADQHEDQQPSSEVIHRFPFGFFAARLRALSRRGAAREERRHR